MYRLASSMAARQQSISVTDEQWDLVQKEAQRRGVNPSIVIRDLCYLGLGTEELEEERKRADRIRNKMMAANAMLFCAIAVFNGGLLG